MTPLDAVMLVLGIGFALVLFLVLESVSNPQ